MRREKIVGTDTVVEIVSKLSEGNPGAINAMMSMLQVEGASPLDLLNLDDMNMRGPAIWIGFKDYAGGKPDVFLNAIRERKKEMISFINQEHHDDSGPVVSGGASFTRGRK